MIDEAGSFAAFSVCADSYVPDRMHKTLEIIPSPIPGFYFPTLIIIGCVTTHRWFAETFGPGVSGQETDDAFTALDRKASALPPGSEKLINVGLLGGRGYPPDPDVRGAWIGFSWGHRREHFHRSILEGFAYENTLGFEAMKDNYPQLDFREVRVIGGGARSILWNRIKSDVLGLPYVKLSREDLTLLGDVLLAGTAAGVYDSLQEAASRFISHTETVEPDPARHRFYESYVSLYRSLFPRMRDVYADVRNLPDFTG
jgi:xylulokinase